jgi:hypothetical protein
LGSLLGFAWTWAAELAVPSVVPSAALLTSPSVQQFRQSIAAGS